jgi:hypothetical protein
MSSENGRDSSCTSGFDQHPYEGEAHGDLSYMGRDELDYYVNHGGHLPAQRHPSLMTRTLGKNHRSLPSNNGPLDDFHHPQRNMSNMPESQVYSSPWRALNHCDSSVKAAYTGSISEPSALQNSRHMSLYGTEPALYDDMLHAGTHLDQPSWFSHPRIVPHDAISLSGRHSMKSRDGQALD